MAKVIIVEDDPMVSSINQKYIEKVDGLSVVKVFRDGKLALKYLENESVDLAVLDLYMPKMTGLELLHEIRKRNIACEVIMVTAANDLESVKDAMNYGTIDYLVKPFTFERFKQAFDKFLSKTKMLSSNELSQEEIDQLISSSSYSKSSLESYEKGINNRTLEELIQHLEQAKPNYMSSEELSKVSGFSMVTIRRYMNYLIEHGKVDSYIDYNTGGRPKINYRASEE